MASDNAGQLRRLMSEGFGGGKMSVPDEMMSAEDANKMSEEINHPRRRFLGIAAMGIAATEFGVLGSAAAQAGTAKPAVATTLMPGTNASFGPLKQINAGLLNIGYAEAGPSGGPVVI